MRMKTTFDIPDKTLEEAIRFAGARTKRAAVLTALEEFNRRHRMAHLAKSFGTCRQMMTMQELHKQRAKG